MIASMLDYTLDDLLLFTPEVYFRLISQYHQFYWPLQVAGLLLGVWLVWRTLFQRGRDMRLIVFGLAACWIFIGIAFHINKFNAVNWMAVWFGAGFILQALMLGLVGLQGPQLIEGVANGLSFFAVVGVLILGVVGYPVAGLLQGQAIDALPFFGIAGAPTLIVTLGVLVLLRDARWWLFLLPLLLLLVEGLTLYLLGSGEWIVFLIVVFVLLFARWQLRRTSQIT